MKFGKEAIKKEVLEKGKEKGKIALIIEHVRNFLQKSYQNNIPALSGQSAFFILLSIVPLLLFVFSLYSILTGNDPESISLPEELKGIEDESNILLILFRYVENSIIQSSSGTTIVTAVMALWSAGKGIYCVTEGISRVYQIPNKRFWVFKRLSAMLYTVVLMLMMLVCIAVMVANFFLAGILMELWHEAFVRWLMIVLSYLLFGVLLTLLLSLGVKLYLWRRLDNKRYYSMRALFPGIFLTVIAWNVLTIGVMLYIRYFSTASIYGSLGTVFVLMVWLYFMAYILLYGIQLNYIYRAQFSRKGWFKRGKDKLKAQEEETEDETVNTAE